MKIYLNKEGQKAPSKVETTESVTVKELIRTHLPNGSDIVIEEYFVFKEDEETEIDINCRLDDSGIKDKHHLHCHKCRKVSVEINYNGGIYDLHASPANTAGNIIKRAADHFHIDPMTIPDLILKTTTGDTLDDSEHIGTRVKFPDCKIQLTLCPKKPIQG